MTLPNTFEYKLSALAYTVPLYTILMKIKIHQFIKDTKIEAIHIHDIRIAQSVFNANKKHNLPVVLDLHDNMPEVMKLYPMLLSTTLLINQILELLLQNL